MSSIRSLLVQLDSTPAAAARLRTAQALALRHAAVLTGAFVAAAPAAAMATALSPVPGELLVRADRAEYDAAHALFEAARSQANVPMHWLEPDAEGLSAGFIAEAAYADLLVLGADDAGRAGGAPAGFVASALIASGRPGLVLPGTLPRQPDPECALVGWDASAPAARALAAALPWLQAARRVLVLDGAPEPGRIRSYLQLHGIEAQVVDAPPGDEPGTALLVLAQRHAADLLVMGCQGHGPLLELVFGGATRSALQHSTVPLLMAH